MSKKKLKKRIRELEAENIMLRAMQSYPIYIYLYRDVPYNPYWCPYRWQPIGPSIPTPIWKVEPITTMPWVINVGSTVSFPSDNITVSYDGNAIIEIGSTSYHSVTDRTIVQGTAVD